MTHIAVFADATDSAAAPVALYQDAAAIAAALSGKGIRYARQVLPADIAGAAPEDVLAQLGGLVETLKQVFGYESCDVVKVTPDMPTVAQARAGFLKEHTHAEDECRLMIAGSGSFYLHLGDQVIEAAVTAGDLISVPAGVKHWFDMGAQPSFTALRLFTNPDGWKADFTGDEIALRFNLGDL